MSKTLGYPVYNARTAPESDERSLTYAKIPAQEVGTVGELTDLGFRVVDVNVILRRGPGGVEWAPSVVRALPEHHGDLLRIAGTCFDGSRMHLDPLFPNEESDKVKREWIQSFLAGTRGIELLVALDDGEPVGFLAVSQDRRHRYIDLLGVDPYRRRQGVGEALISSFIAGGDDRHELRVGTQVSNVASLRLYQRMGFTIFSSSYVLHLHRGARAW